jgi:hypothetical protein
MRGSSLVFIAAAAAVVALLFGWLVGAVIVPWVASWSA